MQLHTAFRSPLPPSQTPEHCNCGTPSCLRWLHPGACRCTTTGISTAPWNSTGTVEFLGFLHSLVLKICFFWGSPSIASRSFCNIFLKKKKVSGRYHPFEGSFPFFSFFLCFSLLFFFFLFSVFLEKCVFSSFFHGYAASSLCISVYL